MNHEPDFKPEPEQDPRTMFVRSTVSNPLLDPEFDDFTFEPDPRWNYQHENC